MSGYFLHKCGNEKLFSQYNILNLPSHITFFIVMVCLRFGLCWHKEQSGAMIEVHTGWYQIIPFYELWMLFAKGDKGNNCYGEAPK